MIAIKIPPTYEIERRYILNVMFTEFLGLDIDITTDPRQNVSIFYKDCELLIADGLFATPPEQWLKEDSLPTQPLKVWNLETTKLNAITVNSDIPVIYGDDPDRPNFFIHSAQKIYLGLDLFGSAFFMLTRYEEVVTPSEHEQFPGTFPATKSLAYQEGFLDRPIINEYLEILWACIQHLCPELQRKTYQFQTDVSHDIDEPFMYAFTGVSRLLKRCGGDVLRRHSLLKAGKSILDWIQVKTGNPAADPCNTFDLIMDISEQHNLKSSFYFITDHSGGAIDGNYTMNHPLIRSLLSNIHERGHEVGLHPSYNTYKDAAQTKKEFEILKQVCIEEGIKQEFWGGRQHYLRWETPTTFQNWEDAGLDYDSTLSFVDIVGFRCGICYEYPTFNIKTRQPLKLRERPLIIMECTILEQEFMNLSIDDDATMERMAKYKQICQLFQGDFRLLWHNNRFIDRRELDVYKQLVSL
jgi:hypothetical protein